MGSRRMFIKGVLIVIALVLLPIIATGAIQVVNGAYQGFPIVRLVMNNEEIKLDRVPAVLLNGSTMVPLRVVSENLGAEVDWDQSTQTAFIISSKGDILDKKPEAYKPQQQWGIEDRVYILSSMGFDYTNTSKYLKNKNIKYGMLAGSIQHVYKGLSTYSEEMKRSNTVLFYNYVDEDFDILKDWPAEYGWLLPYNYDDLSRLSPPYGWLQKDSSGMIRGIVVGDNQIILHEILKLMTEEKVPLGEPFTIRREISYEPALKLSDSWVNTPQKAILEGVNFTISYHEGYESDAIKMLQWANDTLKRLEKHFNDPIKAIGKPITIYLQPPQQVDYGMAYADPINTNMRFLYPSIAIENSSYYDENWYIGNIAHEFAHIYDYALRTKAGGFSFDSTPSWFREGFGEYFRLLVIEQQSRLDRDNASGKADIIQNGLNNISDVYRSGYWVFRFLSDRFGHDGIIEIFNSKENTFWGAFEKVTRLNAVELEKELKQWLMD